MIRTKWSCPIKKQSKKACWTCRYAKHGICDFPYALAGTYYCLNCGEDAE